jgi:hypothetical protein
MRNLMTLDLQQLQTDIKGALKSAAKEVADKMEQPTEQWSRDHTPKFGVVGPTNEGGNLVVFGGVLPGQDEKAQVYLWVTRGTKPHDIYPRPENKSGLLRFPVPYYPSTTRRDWSSRQASAGDEIVRSPHVRHPGAEAREFEELAAEEIQPVLVENVRLAVAGLFTGGQKWVSW